MRDQSPLAPADWRMVAVVAATPFLHFAFRDAFESSLWVTGHIAVDVVLAGILAVLVTAVFYGGPILAMQRGGGNVWEVIERSVGTDFTLVVRVVWFVFLVGWIADRAGPLTYWQNFLYAEPPWARAAYALLLALLLATALEGALTNAKLALFACKVYVAVLIATAFRVREGWGTVFPGSGVGPEVAAMAGYVAPLGLMTAALAARIPGRRQTVLALTLGVALPLFAAVAISGLVSAATFGSGFYTPSLEPTVAMGFLRHVSEKALPWRFLIIGVTMIGVVRFAAVSMAQAGELVQKPVLAVVALPVTALSLSSADWTVVIGYLGMLLSAVAGLITADMLLGLSDGPRRRADVVGSIAVLIGLAMGIWAGTSAVAWVAGFTTGALRRMRNALR